MRLVLRVEEMTARRGGEGKSRREMVERRVAMEALQTVGSSFRRLRDHMMVLGLPPGRGGS